ncbi:delta-like protein A [Haliotis rufescens]|uniref:delta-like protein A n=1 Tax=Haliotis rufescens TaxID=6454 RepID=UPI00201EAE48|nr:delta-like protein A [Haliotis rufescens]
MRQDACKCAKVQLDLFSVPPVVTSLQEGQIDHCDRSSCVNGGTCLSSATGFSCACPAGYTGLTCEVEIDHCDRSSCVNGGMCLSSATGFSCACPAGYTGLTCEVEIDHCDRSSCVNGGTCLSSATGFSCACPAGYTGLTCEVEIDHCDRSSCVNGGTCLSSATGFSCACPAGYTGLTCEACSGRKLDILIMDDMSLSIGQTNFDEMKRFQERMLSHTVINSGADNVALLVFAAKATVVLPLNHDKSKAGVMRALREQVYEEGPSTSIGDAISLATAEVFKPQNGDRADADNIVFMFTDGLVTDGDRVAILANSVTLKVVAEVYVVVTSEVTDTSTLNAIASKPSNIFQLGSPTAVSAIQRIMMPCSNH